jgi:hypothetical protein
MSSRGEWPVRLRPKIVYRPPGSPHPSVQREACAAARLDVMDPFLPSFNQPMARWLELSHVHLNLRLEVDNHSAFLSLQTIEFPLGFPTHIPASFIGSRLLQVHSSPLSCSFRTFLPAPNLKVEGVESTQPTLTTATGAGHSRSWIPPILSVRASIGSVTVAFQFILAFLAIRRNCCAAPRH